MEAADDDDDDTFDAQWEAITGRAPAAALAAEAEPDRAAAPAAAGANVVDQMGLNVADALGPALRAQGYPSLAEAVRAARDDGIAGIRTVTTAQLRELSDRLFALKETMPDESFRQLSDALMSAHNRVAA